MAKKEDEKKTYVYKEETTAPIVNTGNTASGTADIGPAITAVQNADGTTSEVISKAIDNAKNGVVPTASASSNPTVQAAAETAAASKPVVSEDLMDQILNRPKFSYNAESDPLYQQYRQMYLDQGKIAAKDVYGQAVAMTGGYGNTYAQGVSQQTYNDYAARAADKIPELYQLALDRYNREGDEMRANYGLLHGAEREAIDDSYREREMALAELSEGHTYELGLGNLDVSRTNAETSRLSLEQDDKHFYDSLGWDREKFWAEFNEDARQYGLDHALKVREQELDEKVANHQITMDERNYALNYLKITNDIESDKDARKLAWANYNLNYDKFAEDCRHNKTAEAIDQFIAGVDAEYKRGNLTLAEKEQLINEAATTAKINQGWASLTMSQNANKNPGNGNSGDGSDDPDFVPGKDLTTKERDAAINQAVKWIEQGMDYESCANLIEQMYGTDEGLRIMKAEGVLRVWKTRKKKSGAAGGAINSFGN